jgi:integrase
MLTDAAARKAVQGEKPYKLYDSGGLFLLVTKSGSKLWRMKYELGGREKLLSFGPYPYVTITAARDARDAARVELRAGRDPSLTRKVMRANAVATDRGFEVIARAWHELHRNKWSDRHAEDVIGSLEAMVFPSLGTIDVREITAPMVLEVLRRIEARPAIETARRVRQRMSAVFVHAISCGLAVADPAAVVRGALAPLVHKRQPALVRFDQVRQMLADVEAEHAHPVTKLAMRLLALTAVRPGTLTGTLWGEFEGLDGDGALWEIPAERMKGAKEAKQGHLVPLSRQAAEVIEAVRQLTGRAKFVFPNARSAHRPMSENALGYLLNRAGYHSRHVPHGWRSSFSTLMNESFPADSAVIEVMLAHVLQNKTAGAYNRAIYIERRRELAQLWADMLLKDMPAAATLLVGPKR